MRLLHKRFTDIQVVGVVAALFALSIVSVVVLARGNVSSLSIGHLTLLLPLTGSGNTNETMVVSQPLHMVVNQSSPDIATTTETTTTLERRTVVPITPTITATTMVSVPTETAVPTQTRSATPVVSPTMVPTITITVTPTIVSTPTPPMTPTIGTTATQVVSPTAEPIEPTPTATVEPAQPAEPIEEEPIAPAVYIVEEGDTIADIAEELGIDGLLMLQVNDMTEEDAANIYPGQELIVPGPSDVLVEPSEPEVPAAPNTYIIEEGDTLRSIAEQFGIDIETLLQINGMTAEDADTIRPGQELVIP